MTTADTTPAPRSRGPFAWFNDLKIGWRLALSFLVIVILTAGIAGVGYFASQDALQRISSTEDVRQPTALAAARAQTSLLRMFSDMRAYLAFGNPSFLQEYRQSEAVFAAELENLARLSTNLDAENQAKLAELEALFAEWQSSIPALIEFREDQIQREPAYALLSTRGAELVGNILIDMDTMIELQAQREPSSANATLLADMSSIKSSFESMYSGLRSYATTRNLIYRFFEYEVNRDINETEWQRLSLRQEQLTPEQQDLFTQIDTNRTAFLEEIPADVFAIMESDGYRQDLELFSSEGVRITNAMQTNLGEIVESQQAALDADLATSRTSLIDARSLTLVLGLLAVLGAIFLAFVSTRVIVRPVEMLTGTANRVKDGDLSARADIQSKDEVGVLAQTFNGMAAQIQSNLVQIRREKKRADDLLHVVIPIGVALSNEKDFNRLLQNTLDEAQTFCNADTGILYLLAKDQLRYEIVQVTSRAIVQGGSSAQSSQFAPLSIDDPDSIAAYVARTGKGLNIPDVAAGKLQDGSDMPASGVPVVFGDDPYTVTSMLTLPLTNARGEVKGVLQLINAFDTERGEVAAFDENLNQMMESLSSLAVAALEAYIREQSLRREIEELRIEIDEAKRKKQVSEIVDTEVFQELQARAQNLRARRRQQTRKNNNDQS